MLPSFMTNQEFIRNRYPLVSDHGTDVRDYSATPDSDAFRGSVQPAGDGTTDRVNRNGAEVVMAIWAPPGVDVQHDDLITLDDGDYFVNGAPERWNVGILDHVVISLSRWVG